MRRLVSVLCAAMLCVAPAHAAPAPFTDRGIPTGGEGGIHPLPAAATVEEIFRPGLNPAGSNDFSCRPAKGQRPVVLIPGTTGSTFSSFSGLSPVLKAEGLCVFTFNHNPLGYTSQMSFGGDIAESAAMLATVVDRVLAETGAEQVDLVGWSQGGGPMAVYYLNKLGGAPKVRKVVGIVPSHHGTELGALRGLIDAQSSSRTRLEHAGAAINAQALMQQLAGSDFLIDLYSEPITSDYMNISTVFDQVVRPNTNSFLPGADNRLVQDYCPGRRTTHFNSTYDPVVYALVLEGLSGVPRDKDCATPPPIG